MALSDFFRINMPYGMSRNEKDEWFVFNREYMPLGWNSHENQQSVIYGHGYTEFPVYTKYKGLTEKEIAKMIPDPIYIQRNEDNHITRVFFYNDSTNPKSNTGHWETYFKIIKELSKFDREDKSYH